MGRKVAAMIIQKVKNDGADDALPVAKQKKTIQ
jgi:hypothetical protein